MYSKQAANAEQTVTGNNCDDLHLSLLIYQWRKHISYAFCIKKKCQGRIVPNLIKPG